MEMMNRAGNDMAQPPLNLPQFPFRTREQSGKLQIFDARRRKYVALTPEEWVRQHFVRFLIEDRGYPGGLTHVEATVKVFDFSRRCDAVIYTPQMRPVVIIECKAPSVSISEETFRQIGVYNAVIRAPLLMVTNGMVHYCCTVDHAAERYHFLEAIPTYAGIADILENHDQETE